MVCDRRGYSNSRRYGLHERLRFRKDYERFANFPNFRRNERHSEIIYRFNRFVKHIFRAARRSLRSFLRAEIIFVVGIQFAGGHLKQLQRAFKNPAANLGLIIDEVRKRAVRSVGLDGGPSMTHLVDPKLANEAAILSKVSKSVEYLIESRFSTVNLNELC